jgi:hypothetical protein
LRQPPWHEGQIDGPARDTDHFAGNAVRRRPRRASARWTATAAAPRQDRKGSLTSVRNCIRPSIGLLLPGPMAIPEAAPILLPAPFRCVRRAFACRRHDTCATHSAVDTSSVARRNRRKPMHLQHPAAYLLIIEVRSFGPEGMETKRDGQPADGAIRRDRPPGSSRVPRRRVHLQGRADRLASSSSVLRRLGEGSWRDSQPDRRARSHLELQLPSITGRLTLLATGTTE